MKLDLESVEAGAALVLAAVVADQVACNLGTGTIVHVLGDGELTVSLCEPGDKLIDIFGAHLGRALGEGFKVELDGEMATVSLDFSDGEEEETEPGGGVVPRGELPPGEEKPKKKRGRPAKRVA